MRSRGFLLLGLSLVLICCADLCHAGRIASGLRLGLNFASLYGDDIDSSRARVGLCFGGFVSLSFTRNFGAQTELLYMQKGSYEEVDLWGEPFKTTIKIDYLEVPFLVKVSLPTGGGLTPSVYVGPAVAFKLGSSVEYQLGGVSVEGALENVKGTDVGLVLGTGLAFGRGTAGLVLDFRYTAGLATIDGSEGGNPLDLKNSVASLSLGMFISP